MTLALALLFGAVIGVLLGLLGGGGSILAVPVLVYALDLPLSEAVPTSLLVVGIAAATGMVIVSTMALAIMLTKFRVRRD